ncbi:MAG: hypothetical protein O2971_15085 [Proteobacteria bacterium]|nr:hypothetical protein [Pseudomonadota bacterium]
MTFDQQLNSFGVVPFTHGSLLPLLEGYSRPNDKIASLLARQDIVQLRRGLYILGPARRRGPLSLPLLANLLNGPSYVSLDFALSWHGLIPEGVLEVSSVTTRRASVYDTPLGRFSYTRLPLPFYRIGVSRMQNTDGTAFLMASREKALCDKVALTRNLPVSSVVGMKTFLIEDLRVDTGLLQDMNLAIVGECVEAGYKQRHMALLLKALRTT